MPSDPILEVQGVSKRLGKIQAVEQLSLRVYKNDIYGFLGPNGSGKSTSIRMMLSLLKPDRGEIHVFGLPLSTNRNKILRKIGSFIEKPDFYEYLSGRKNLEILSGYSGIPINHTKIDETLELVGLTDRGASRVKTYSKGMKQRLGIAQALLHDPELIILDEPASGLDPTGARDIRNLIRLLNEDHQKTILLSSHNLNEIEIIANRMAIIKKGSKVVEGSVSTLLASQLFMHKLELAPIDQAHTILKESRLEIESIEVQDQLLLVHCKKELIPEITRILVSNNIQVRSIRTEQTLEDYFFDLT